MAKKTPKPTVDQTPVEKKKRDRTKPVIGKIAITRDPRLWRSFVDRKTLSVRRVLGLDISSSCGAAICDMVPEQPITCGSLLGFQWDLGLSTHDTQGVRYLRMMQYLRMAEPDLVIYEEVKYSGKAVPPGVHMTAAQLIARAVSGAQVVHALSAMLLVWAERRKIPCIGVPIGKLKRYATGSGAANKEDMIRACNAKFGTDLDVATYQQTGADNIADAMFLCAMGVDEMTQLSADAFSPGATDDRD